MKTLIVCTKRGWKRETYEKTGDTVTVEEIGRNKTFDCWKTVSSERIDYEEVLSDRKREGD